MILLKWDVLEVNKKVSINMILLKWDTLEVNETVFINMILPKFWIRFTITF